MSETICKRCGGRAFAPEHPFSPEHLDERAAPRPGPSAGEEPQDSEPQDSLLHPAHQVFFRAGLIACREYMARFVEAQDPTIAMSIRANWWPSLGQDYGPPRQLDWSEVTDGEYGTDAFRVRTAAEVSPTQEALPIALAFLNGNLLAGPPVAAPPSVKTNAANPLTDGEPLKAICLDCGLPYSEFPLDVVLPRSQWLDIHPADGGLLCAACIVKRAAKVPGCTVAHMVLEIAPRPRPEEPTQ